MQPPSRASKGEERIYSSSSSSTSSPPSAALAFFLLTRPKRPPPKGAGDGEVDVLLGVEADDERGDVDDLLPDADVALADEDAGVVDGLGEAELPHEGLEAALEEVLDLEGKDVIELHAGLVEDTDAHETANEGVTLEETLGVLLVESEELTGQLLTEFSPEV